MPPAAVSGDPPPTDQFGPVDLSALGRVLVTGSSGLIGSALVDRLTAGGVAVTALDRVAPADTTTDRVIVGDVTEVDVVAEALTDVQAVAHLAAIPTPLGHVPYEVFRTNTNATFNVLDQAGRRGIRRAVIASSINATGIPFNPHPVLPAYYPMDEELPIDLGDAYSLSKQVDEHTARMIARRDGIDVVSLRFPFVASVSDIRRASERARSDPEPATREGWSYLDVRDAAEVICAALVGPVTGAVVLCVAAPDNIVGMEAAELVRDHAPGVPVRGEVTGTASLYSSAKARRLLAWTAQHLLSTDSS